LSTRASSGGAESVGAWQGVEHAVAFEIVPI
jgi:hypothetical protein